MNALASGIQQLGLSGKPESILESLSQVVVISKDTTKRDWTYVSGLLDSLGAPPEQIDALYELLPTVPGGLSFRAALLSGGVDFSLYATKLEAHRDKLGALTDVLIGIGTTLGVAWQKIGLQSEPTLEDVAAALRQIEVQQWYATLINETLNPSNLETKTVAELKKMITGE